MRILLVNDDGVHSPGLVALKRVFSARFGPVSVVAPARQQSGMAHSITLHDAIEVRSLGKEGEVVSFAVDGTPADCVKLAVGALLKTPPSLVVSGINLGANVGINVIYSGTVAAALEASALGFPALAISLDYSPRPDFDLAAQIAMDLIERLPREVLAPGRAINVNIPACRRDDIRGLYVGRQDLSPYAERFDVVPTAGGMSIRILGDVQHREGEISTDLQALRAGYITITPLKYDLTDDVLLERMKSMKL